MVADGWRFIQQNKVPLAHLHITLDFGEGAPLETDVALRGVAQ